MGVEDLAGDDTGTAKLLFVVSVTASETDDVARILTGTSIVEDGVAVFESLVTMG